ncbi:MAG: NAD(P) transhydrogenase subunit alpha [Granulosicoccus sp.]|nr:NAD(P) transhydrogenase subunit alpha [Granulosicoccus sp.]
MDAFVALYLLMLAGITGYVLIANVPSILHTPLLSGSNFIHGVVLAGAMVALGHAEGALQTTIGFFGVMAATANVVGGYIVTDRMLAMFESSAKRNQRRLEQEQKLLAERNKSVNDNAEDNIEQQALSGDGNKSGDGSQSE